MRSIFSSLVESSSNDFELSTPEAYSTERQLTWHYSPKIGSKWSNGSGWDLSLQHVRTALPICRQRERCVFSMTNISSSPICDRQVLFEISSRIRSLKSTL